MSRPIDSDRFPPPLVVIVDTSVLIELKRIVPVGKQWGLLNLMSELLDAGHLAYPRQVSREMAVAQFPDAPGAWATGCNGHARHSEPRDDSIAEVLGVAQLVDAEAEAQPEAADPYVAAMAWELRQRHPDCQVVVATNDVRDRLPVKEALATACARLEIECWDAEVFVRWLESYEPS